MTLHHTAQRDGPLLSFLRRELSLSSSLVARLKWQNAFFVGGEAAHTNRPVRRGEEITVEIRESPEGFPAEKMALSILYEDEFLIALDKPAGILMHPSPCRNEGTLANGLLYYFQQTGQPCGIHPVSRLDRDTFGVVLLAKSAHVHEKFRQLHQSGGLQKTYLAAVYGAPDADSGTIDLPVYKIGGGSLLRVVDARGQRAVTEYAVLVRCAQTALLQLRPLTGRTHQLRLHCLASGFPILGDPQYRTEASAAFSGARGISPQQLCAKRIRFPHPMTGAELCVESAQSVRFPGE